jgi:hypothetical protein
MELTRPPLIMEAHVRSQPSPYGMCDEQNGIGTDFSPNTSGFLLSVSFHQCPTLIRHRRYTNLTTGGVLLIKPFYCRVSRVAVCRADVSIHEPCLVPEAPVYTPRHC